MVILGINIKDDLGIAPMHFRPILDIFAINYFIKKYSNGKAPNKQLYSNDLVIIVLS
jgi:hypothetical protein